MAWPAPSTCPFDRSACLSLAIMFEARLAQGALLKKASLRAASKGGSHLQRAVERSSTPTRGAGSTQPHRWQPTGDRCSWFQNLPAAAPCAGGGGDQGPDRGCQLRLQQQRLQPAGDGLQPCQPGGALAAGRRLRALPLRSQHQHGCDGARGGPHALRRGAARRRRHSGTPPTAASCACCPVPMPAMQA